jgi:hypothetical protein
LQQLSAVALPPGEGEEALSLFSGLQVMEKIGWKLQRLGFECMI